MVCASHDTALTHMPTHARTHARMHARSHAHTQVVEHFEMLCVNSIRLSNPLLHQGAVKLGVYVPDSRSLFLARSHEGTDYHCCVRYTGDHLLQAGKSKEAVGLLRDAVEGLVMMVATGVSQVKVCVCVCVCV